MMKSLYCLFYLLISISLLSYVKTGEPSFLKTDKAKGIEAMKKKQYKVAIQFFRDYIQYPYSPGSKISCLHMLSNALIMEKRYIEGLVIKHYIFHEVSTSYSNKGKKKEDKKVEVELLVSLGISHLLLGNSLIAQRVASIALDTIDRAYLNSSIPSKQLKVLREIKKYPEKTAKKAIKEFGKIAPCSYETLYKPRLFFGRDADLSDIVTYLVPLLFFAVLSGISTFGLCKMVWQKSDDASTFLMILLFSLFMTVGLYRRMPPALPIIRNYLAAKRHYCQAKSMWIKVTEDGIILSHKNPAGGEKLISVVIPYSRVDKVKFDRENLVGTLTIKPVNEEGSKGVPTPIVYTFLLDNNHVLNEVLICLRFIKIKQIEYEVGKTGKFGLLSEIEI